MGEHPSSALSLRSRERNTSAKTALHAGSTDVSVLAVTRIRIPYEVAGWTTVEALFQWAWSVKIG
jgi:hypothetical protein